MKKVDVFDILQAKFNCILGWFYCPGGTLTVVSLPSLCLLWGVSTGIAQTRAHT